MKALMLKFVKDDSGATAIEYALIAGLLSVAIIGVLVTVSGQLLAVWNAIATALGTAVAG